MGFHKLFSLTMVFAIVLVIAMTLGIELFTAAAGIAGLGVIVFFITWTNFPLWLRRFLTHKPMIILQDAVIWYYGWNILPDSSLIKLGFVMFHLGFVPLMWWEHYRSRGQLPWQKKGRSWSSS